ncbi:hypothetical protein L6452_16065 [Arctium lappa]|uniref:Uncharacterized protein n=1 Tax=Arctium lappa TaxID=4217 RepID=A0ACB9BZL1_ARCLA|nr:hypothetical protein L6452_16065 [Arctium lappa]
MKRPFNTLTHAIHVFHCPDQVGIVAKISECIASRGGNILIPDIFVLQNKNVFYSRRTTICNQVLSGSFLKRYGKDAFNIHHGLLPSFKGGNPSRQQAFEAGVKLIGATSHFVTEELDGGPIIEQMVERISHKDNLLSFIQKSENLEPFEGNKIIL